MYAYFSYNHFKCNFIIVMVNVDNPKLVKIDPSHPTLRGFQLEYEWRDAPIEDPRFGLQVLCFSCFIGFIILVVVIVINADAEAEEISATADGSSHRRTNNTAPAERKRK